MSKLNSTAIIAARANSKGIKNKNLQNINKKNLVQISIEQALRTCETVILSSDSAEINEIGRQYDGVFIIYRSPELAKDETPKLPVLRNAIEIYEKEVGECSDIIFDLQPTSPFRKDDSIRKSFELFQKYVDSTNLVSISLTSFHPSYNLLEFKENNEVELLNRTSEPITGRNMLPDTYKMDGCIFIWRKKILMTNVENRVILNNTIGYRVSEIESLDIDNQADLDYARYISEKLTE